MVHCAVEGMNDKAKKKSHDAMRVCLAPMGASLKDQTIKTNKFLPHSTLPLLYISNRVFPMCVCLTALKQRRSQRFLVLFRYKN